LCQRAPGRTHGAADALDEPLLGRDQLALALTLVNTSRVQLTRGIAACTRAVAWITTAALTALGAGFALPALAASFAFPWPGVGVVSAAILLGALTMESWHALKRSGPVQRALGAPPATR
jgi:hypothetical protein